MFRSLQLEFEGGGAEAEMGDHHEQWRRGCEAPRWGASRACPVAASPLVEAAGVFRSSQSSSSFDWSSCAEEGERRGSVRVVFLQGRLSLRQHAPKEACLLTHLSPMPPKTLFGACSRCVFRSFKRAERGMDRLTGRAGPVFVGLAVILILICAVTFFDVRPVLLPAARTQLTTLLAGRLPTPLPGADYLVPHLRAGHSVVLLRCIYVHVPRTLLPGPLAAPLIQRRSTTKPSLSARALRSTLLAPRLTRG